MDFKHLTLGLALLLPIACKDETAQKPDDPPGQTGQPAQQADPPRSATQPAPPPPVMMMVEGRPFDFPSARLVFMPRQQTVRLHSDDPREIIRDDFTGNSFYFTLDVEADDPSAKLVEEGWRKSWSSVEEGSETINGIFLEGNRKHLQPRTIELAFEPYEGQMRVRLTGEFLMVDLMDLNTPQKMVMVDATFVSAISTRDK